jgi:hypothetical protein
MTLVLTVPLIFALLGLVIYIISANTKLVEVGRLTYFAGLLAFLIRVYAGGN